mgnify:CR=1 FL=1
MNTHFLLFLLSATVPLASHAQKATYVSPVKFQIGQQFTAICTVAVPDLTKDYYVGFMIGRNITIGEFKALGR